MLIKLHIVNADSTHAHWLNAEDILGVVDRSEVENRESAMASISFKHNNEVIYVTETADEVVALVNGTAPNTPSDVAEQMADALKVVVTNHKSRKWMAKNDPKMAEQIGAALDAYDASYKS